MLTSLYHTHLLSYKPNETGLTLIMKVALFFLTLMVFAASSVFGQCPECWQQCFKSPSATYNDEYAEILGMITDLRTAKALHGTEATHFAFDGTDDSRARFNYQKMLAAITALALPTNPKDPCANPLYVSNYYEWFAYISGRGICRDTCTMANMDDGPLGRGNMSPGLALQPIT